MIFHLTLITLHAFSFAMVRTSHAEDGCINPKSAYDRTYCSSKLFVESDKELNEVYKELRHALDKETSKKLTQAQIKWLSFRDKTCSDNGTIFVDCNFKVNKERTEYLRDRLRECKTGHCNSDSVGKTDFLPQ